MTAAVLTGVATGVAALLVAGVISLVRLGGVVRALSTEVRIRFDTSDKALAELRSDVRALRESARTKTLAENWRRHCG